MLATIVRWIASLVVALCLVAAGAARPDDAGASRSHTSLASAGHGLAANVAPRRVVAGHDLGLSAFTLPTTPAADEPSRTVTVPCDRAPDRALATQIFTRSSRGPPAGAA
jgi:hypothetical protein